MLEAALFWGLVGSIVLAPLAIGAVQPWTWTLLAAIVGGLLAAWGVQVLRGAPLVALRHVRVPAGLFGLVIAWATIQVLPIAPATWQHPLWDDAATALNRDLAGTISLNPDEGMNGIVRLLTYAGIVLLALNLCRDADRAYRAVQAVAVAAALYAAYGLVVYFSGNDSILWFGKPAYHGDLTAVFVNRNAFAAYAGLGLLCVTALLMRGVGRAARSGLPRSERRRRLLLYAATGGALYAAMWATIFSALLLSHSRGGFLSCVIGLFGFILLGAASGPGALRRATAFVGIAGLVALPLLLTVSGGQVIARLMQAESEAPSRLLLYERTIAAIGDAPLLGTGLGTFKEVIRLYRTDGMVETFFQAHSSYLENALELGVPATGLLLGAIAALAALCLAGLRRRQRDVEFPCLGLAATLLVAGHSLVDFSLQIPAVTATWCLLLGAACAQSWSSRQALSR